MTRAVCIAALLLAASCATTERLTDADVQEALMDLEKQSWVAWKGHDAAFFSRFLSDDDVEVGPRGILGKADIVAGVGSPTCKVESYSVGSFKFTRGSPKIWRWFHIAPSRRPRAAACRSRAPRGRARST